MEQFLKFSGKTKKEKELTPNETWQQVYSVMNYDALKIMKQAFESDLERAYQTNNIKSIEFIKYRLSYINALLPTKF